MAAYFYFAPGERPCLCPYDKTHVVSNVKLGNHLAKCRKNYLADCAKKGIEPDIVICKFNHLHQLPRSEMVHHESRCADQLSVARYLQSSSAK